MLTSEHERVDLIKELRLRRWARRNYVVPEDRRSTWHPIVINEMRSMDAERLQQPAAGNSLFVPLVPEQPLVERTVGRVPGTVHSRHDRPGTPNVVRANVGSRPKSPLLGY